MSTAAQITANRANAQLSTGPSSAAGKAKASLNAVKTGLTGQTVVLPSEDAASYQKHLARFFAKYEPATDEERELVQSIADTEWRLLRIPTLEAGFYAIGFVELGDAFSDQPDPAVRDAMLRAHIRRTYRKDFNNLNLQETRLRRQRDADIEQLLKLQDDRTSLERESLKNCLYEFQKAQMNRQPFDSKDFGFDFTIAELTERNKFQRLENGQGLAKYQRCNKILAGLKAA